MQEWAKMKQQNKSKREMMIQWKKKVCNKIMRKLRTIGNGLYHQTKFWVQNIEMTLNITKWKMYLIFAHIDRRNGKLERDIKHRFCGLYMNQSIATTSIELARIIHVKKDLKELFAVSISIFVCVTYCVCYLLFKKLI